MVAAFKTALITDADVWDELAAARNDTSHEYNQAKAMEIVAFLRARATAGFDALLVSFESR